MILQCPNTIRDLLVAHGFEVELVTYDGVVVKINSSVILLECERLTRALEGRGIDIVDVGSDDIGMSLVASYVPLDKSAEIAVGFEGNIQWK